MKNFVSIKNPSDAAELLKEANHMHDGTLTKVEWKLRRLKVNILISSLPGALLEMVFEDVLSWKITEGEYEIFEADINFDKNGHIVWSDDTIDFENLNKNGSYIIARKLKWRLT